jgi:hypothetical protein
MFFGAASCIPPCAAGCIDMWAHELKDRGMGFSGVSFRVPLGRLVAAACGLTFVAALAGCSSEGNVPPRVAQMGERVQTGDLVYTVLEAQWYTRFGDGLTARTPEHRFLAVRLSATNSSASAKALPALELVSASGGAYPELGDGTGLSGWFGTIRRLQPAETKEGRLLFDVPPASYRLRISDDTFDPAPHQVAMVEIPLTYDATPSGIGLPEAQ